MSNERTANFINDSGEYWEKCQKNPTPTIQLMFIGAMGVRSFQTL